MVHTMNVDDSKLALEGYCPVAYQFGPPKKGTNEFSSEYEGAKYLFVSAEAKEMFDAEPAKYVPLYGGWCGLGMAHGSRAPVDPLNFKLVGDEKSLVLFYKDDKMNTLDMWNDDETNMKVKADDAWESDK